MDNIFEKGCLVQLQISRWGATCQIGKDKLAKMGSSPEWLIGAKKLVDPDSLKPLINVAQNARMYLKQVSLPFPIPGMLFVPKEMIAEVDQLLSEFKTEYHDEVKGFLKEYPSLRVAAAAHLADLFSDLDYPAEVAAKFSFGWRFVILDVPNGQAGVLTPEIYRREKEKFIQTMEEARELAVQALREEFSSLVEHISDRMAVGPDGKPKVFKKATVDNFYDFFETFKQRNIFRDKQLSALVTKAKSLLGGEEAEDIRSDDDLKVKIRSGMAELKKALEPIVNRPRRQIVMN